MTESDKPTITITVSGRNGTGTTSIAFLLADFLSHTGFKTELNTVDDLDADEFERTLSDKLEAIENRGTKLIINEVKVIRKGEIDE